VVQTVQAPTAIAGLPAGYAATYLMVPPPGLPSFSSLKVLQLPSHGMSETWGLVCSAPHHWEALGGCTALQQLEGLHASQPPPAGVKFPGVTRLEAAVAPGDVLGVLAAFPALKQLKLDAVFDESSVVGGAAAEARGVLAHSQWRLGCGILMLTRHCTLPQQACMSSWRDCLSKLIHVRPVLNRSCAAITAATGAATHAAVFMTECFVLHAHSG
jgi:hypothetical protein